jgi:histidinol-phosphate/aromatic aminotransferase/cobyric acid decarboxylase-like protein
MTKNKYDRHHKPFGNAFAIADPLVLETLNMPISALTAIEDSDVPTKFLEAYRSWILSTKNNTVNGLDEFPYACFTNGTTEAFDKFYAKHSTRRFRFFKGEFVYHRLSCRNNGYDWAYIEDDKLDKNDVVIISLPFSDTGNKHEKLDYILHNCTALDIPVLLDCAYFGVCGDLEFNLRHKCIKEITFSLSKTFYSAYLRIGMRLTREDDDDPLFVTNKMGYINRPSAYIGLELLKKFSPDYIYNNYRNRQLEYCIILELEPSQCVLFGLGDERWNDYNRDRETNRLSFHKFLATDCHEEICNEKR